MASLLAAHRVAARGRSFGEVVALAGPHPAEASRTSRCLGVLCGPSGRSVTLPNIRFGKVRRFRG